MTEGEAMDSREESKGITAETTELTLEMTTAETETVTRSLLSAGKLINMILKD